MAQFEIQTSIVKRHKQEQIYKCDVCDKGFTTNSNLTEHYIIHTGKSIYNENRPNGKKYTLMTDYTNVLHVTKDLNLSYRIWQNTHRWKTT